MISIKEMFNENQLEYIDEILNLLIINSCEIKSFYSDSRKYMQLSFGVAEKEVTIYLNISDNKFEVCSVNAYISPTSFNSSLLKEVLTLFYNYYDEIDKMINEINKKIHIFLHSYNITNKNYILAC